MCGLNKKPDFLYFFQKLEQKGKKSSQFWVVIFQFHVCNKWKDIMIKSAIIYMDVLKYQVLFPKGEFLRTHRVGPLGLNGFLHLVLFFRIFHPYEPWPLFSGWWVVGGWAYFLVKFWLFSKLFGSCFKIVWALFLDSEGPYFRVVSAQKKYSRPPKSTFLGEILTIFQNWYPWFDHFGGQKRPLKSVKFWLEISIFEVYYRP